MHKPGQEGKRLVRKLFLFLSILQGNGGAVFGAVDFVEDLDCRAAGPYPFGRPGGRAFPARPVAVLTTIAPVPVNR